MKKLQLAENLALPMDAVTSTVIIYGGKGMGKTNLGSVLVEELSRCGLRWSWLDPLGVSWGLRHSADGKGPGVECLILGGVHGDIPIDPDGGAAVADVVVEEQVNCLIDFSRKPNGEMWSKAAKIKFVTAYALRLFQRQGELQQGRRREPLFQVLDEAARYIPQVLPSGAKDLAECVGAWEQLVEEGRNIGLGVGLLTQRSARMNKSVSELADAMFAFRTTGPNSLEAVLDWLGEHVEKAKLKGLAEQVRALDPGHALVVSPGWLRREEVIAVRLRQTFDSSATPKPGERARSAKGPGARPDLDKIRARMAATLEKAKADDPKELRRQLVEANRMLARQAETIGKQQSGLNQKSKTIEKIDKPALTDADRVLLKKVATSLEDDSKHARENIAAAESRLDQKVQTAVAEYLNTTRNVGLDAAHAVERILDRVGVKKLIEKLHALQIDLPKPASPVAKPVSTNRTQQATSSKPQATTSVPNAPRTLPSGDSGPLKEMPRKMLIALAQHPDGLTKKKIHAYTEYRVSGTTSDTFALMLREGWAETIAPNTLRITPLGYDVLGSFEQLPVGEEFRNTVLAGNKLSLMEKNFLRALFDVYPNDSSKKELHERTGYKVSGSTSDSFAHLVAIDYAVISGPNRLKAASVFFEGE